MHNIYFNLLLGMVALDPFVSFFPPMALTKLFSLLKQCLALLGTSFKYLILPDPSPFLLLTLTLHPSSVKIKNRS